MAVAQAKVRVKVRVAKVRAKEKGKVKFPTANYESQVFLIISEKLLLLNSMQRFVRFMKSVAANTLIPAICGIDQFALSQVAGEASLAGTGTMKMAALSLTQLNSPKILTSVKTESATENKLRQLPLRQLKTTKRLPDMPSASTQHTVCPRHAETFVALGLQTLLSQRSPRGNTLRLYLSKFL